MSTLTGEGLAEYAISKIGTQYIYGMKMESFTQSKYDALAKAYPTVFTSGYKKKIADRSMLNKISVDCSGLIGAYTSKGLGSAQLYSTAYARLSMNDLDKFAVGTVLWKSGHVGVYCGLDSSGNPICTEAKGIDYGVITGTITNPSRWSYGLTFSYIDYTITTAATSVTYKRKNPYSAPTIIVKKNCPFSSCVKWLQYELIESGYGVVFSYGGVSYNPVKIDGDFGVITFAALKAFQTSSKLTVDGECGPITIAALEAAY